MIAFCLKTARVACCGLLFGWAAVLPAQAQSGDTFFHTAAHQFIGGQDAAALASVNEGLRIAPRDARLRRLKEEIEKKQEEQQRQNQEQQDRQEQQDGEQQDQQGEQGDDRQEQNGQNQQQGQNNQPPEQQDEGEPGDEPQQNPGETPEQEPGEGEQEQQARPQPDPSKMSRAEAERILQALGNEEETLLRRVARPQSRARRVEKDW